MYNWREKVKTWLFIRYMWNLTRKWQIDTSEVDFNVQSKKTCQIKGFKFSSSWDTRAVWREKSKPWRFHEKKVLFKWTISLNLDFHNANASVFPSLSYKIRHLPLGLTPSWYRDVFYKNNSGRLKHYHSV